MISTCNPSRESVPKSRSPNGCDMHRIDFFKRVRPHYRERVSGDTAVLRGQDHLLFAAVIDVLGHGDDAHALALEIERFLENSWGDALLDLMNLLHEQIRGSRGAAAGLSLLDRRSGVLRYVGIGNTVLRKFGSTEIRLVSRAGIIGGSMRTAREERMTLAAGDVVLLYTDGVKDRFRLCDYPELLHHDAETIARTVLRRFGKDNDDATCIALRCEK